MRRWRCDRLWAALADPDRPLTVERLREHPLTTGQVQQAMVADGRAGRLTPLSRQHPTSLHGLRDLAQRPAHPTSQENTMPTVNHLTVVQQIDIAAPRARVWRALVEEIGRWWGSPYLHDKDSRTITVEPVLGGQVAETCGDASYSWGVVTAVAPARLLQFTGAQGVGLGVHGDIRYELTTSSGAGQGSEPGTTVTLTHVAFGLFSDSIAAGYEHGWADLQRRLARWVEDGDAFGVLGSNAIPD